MPFRNADWGEISVLKPGLTFDQVEELEVACLEISHDWRIVPQEGYAGTMALVLLHQISDTCFFFDSQINGISLSMMFGENFKDCGSFETMQAAITELREIISGSPYTPYLM